MWSETVECERLGRGNPIPVTTDGRRTEIKLIGGGCNIWVSLLRLDEPAASKWTVEGGGCMQDVLAKSVTMNDAATGSVSDSIFFCVPSYTLSLSNTKATIDYWYDIYFHLNNYAQLMTFRSNERCLCEKSLVLVLKRNRFRHLAHGYRKSNLVFVPWILFVHNFLFDRMGTSNCEGLGKCDTNIGSLHLRKLCVPFQTFPFTLIK